MKTELKSTKDYSIFEMHECNRDLHEKPLLLVSMQKHGFMPSSPIHVKQNGNGKFKVIRGHHRLHYAKRLKLPVYYVVDNSNCDIFELEGEFGQNWTVFDFARARAKAGNKDCAAVIAFKEKHKLTMGAAASLVGGQSANSGNKTKDIKRGTFKVGDMKHAEQVVRIVDLAREKNIGFASSASFVNAISMVHRVPEFDPDVLCHRIGLFAANLRKRGTTLEFLDEIEALYNYGAKAKRIPLKFRAMEVGKNRQETFGKQN